MRGGRIHRQNAKHVALALDLVDHAGRHAAAAQRLDEALRIGIHEARACAHRAIGTDEKCLSRLAHSLFFPLEVSGEDLVEIVDGELEHEHADHLRAVENRTDGEAHGTSEVRAVGLEVDDLEIVAVFLLPHGTDLRAEQRVGVGAGLEIGAEFARFFVAVNNVERVGIDQHHVLEAEDFDRAGEELVQVGVGLAVSGGVTGRFVQVLLRSVGMRVRRGVVVLQVALSRTCRQVLFDDRRALDVFVQLRNEIVAVKRVELGAFLRRERGCTEFAVRGAEGAHAFDHGFAVGNGNDLVAQ